MRTFEYIKSLIHHGSLEAAEKELQDNTSPASFSESERLYLMGLVYSKRSNWANAKGAFLKASELDKDSPAVEALNMLTEIYDFYYKDNLNP